MSEHLEEFKQVLVEEVGDNWVNAASDEQIEYFMDWARECCVYRCCLEPTFKHSGNVGDAFRGFVRGIEFMRGDRDD